MIVSTERRLQFGDERAMACFDHASLGGASPSLLTFATIEQISPDKGRGVVATRAIPRGTTIEIAHVVIVPCKECDLVDHSFLGNYAFNWTDQEGNEARAVPMSPASFMNHSYHPNAAYAKDVAGKRLVLFTIRDVAPGEEIVINYNWRVDELDALWFPVS